MATINCLLHPHHVSMGKGYTSLHMLHQHIDDPYYGLDRRPSHKGVSVPRFDVREGEEAFYLDGELPGLTHMSDVVAEFIENQTLIVRGSIKPKLLSEEKAVSGSGSGAKDSALKWRLQERRIGKFERSFTFPSRIKPDEMKTELEAGVLSTVLPKDKEADVDAAVQMEIENELW